MQSSLYKRVALAVLLVLSFYMMWQTTDGVGETEFSGGRVTGPMLDACEIGMLAFIVALLLLYWFPRISGLIATAAGLGCIPLTFYFFAPGIFRKAYRLIDPRGEWSGGFPPNLVWNSLRVLS